MDTPGHLHPISHLMDRAANIFGAMGFSTAEGPHIESEWYNFDALNVPKDHPARDMQDTFFVAGEPGYVLRTHTSPVQVRYMESEIAAGRTPPYRVIVLGKVCRNEATDTTHEAEFFQLEGLAVGPDISLAHLKGTIDRFYTDMFEGADAEVRFRPSFFPFVEPGVEVDVRLVGKKVPEKLRGKWIEMMGAGMVHPNVLKNSGVDPETYRRFAFGMGLDRLAMLRWEIDDVRLMHSADLRFVTQF